MITGLLGDAAHKTGIELTLFRPVPIMRQRQVDGPFQRRMSSIPKPSWAETWSRVQAGVRHAFATAPETVAWSLEDQALLERIAEAVVQRGMAAPATVFLESLAPMNFVGSQALQVLAPLLEVVLDAKTLDQAARLLERRDTVDRLVRLIEMKSSSHSSSSPTPAQAPTHAAVPTPIHAPKGTSAR